ncbi:MAG: hypothetical protein HOU81_25535 [Hamadaea sp.]|uniref:hypothetical protein n=1 Tax=Hamadaea sp. TaxID=2024425 RepID=UPI00179E4FC8|nr:hypothetical protein [Hamadaea sp.]NUR74186.1 hypothetical protein [Hamadaea sp.]NUT20490.1 hypothetical protein [Hamadaea sp.]
MIRAYRRLVVASAAVLLGLSAATAATADPAVTSPTGTAATTEGGLSLPGLTATAYATTLITGDRVALQQTGSRYTVTATAAQRADGTIPAVDVRAKFGADSATTSVIALPADAGGLVEAGVVDRNTFDVLWLAKRSAAGDTSLSMTVKFGSGMDVAALTQAASVLPGASVAAAHQEAGTVDVRVDAGQAAKFWAAIAPSGSAGALTDYLVRGVAPRLEHGVLGLWPTGHRSPIMAPQNDTGQPLFDVTWVVDAPSGAEPQLCGAMTATMCLFAEPTLAQVGGSAVGTPFDLQELRCVTVNPCTGYEAKFQVPAGVYEAGGLMTFRLAGLDQIFTVEIPEFTVDRNITITTDGDSAQRLTVETPRPSEIYNGTLLTYRSFANGVGGVSMVFTMYGHANYWAVPSAPITVGSFHLGQNWILGEPYVRMRVVKPTKRPLAAIQAGNIYQVDRSFAHFTGQQTVELVDGGLGRAEDLAKIDARGKLVLLQIDDDKLGGICDLGTPALDRAKAAGAVGVLVDPVASNGPWPTMVCNYLPILPAFWTQPSQGRPELPYAAVTHAEAEQLLGMMRTGPVKIEVTGSSQISPYVYNLHLYQEGQIPAALHTKITDSQLAEVQTTLAGSPGVRDTMTYSAFRRNENATGGVMLVGVTEGVRYTTYQGPVSPDLVRVQRDEPGRLTVEVVDRAGPIRAQQWGTGPLVPGAPELSARVFEARPGDFDGGEYYNSVTICSFCRQGNTFYPLLHLVSGASPSIVNGAYIFAPENLHMYADGQELAQGNDFLWGAVYDLPEEAKRYELTGSTSDGATTTKWGFTSGAPAAQAPQRGTWCPQGSRVLCRSESLLFLRYDAGLDATGAVTGGGKHELRLSAYHQSVESATVADLEVSISFDGGTTWQPVKATAQGGGDFAVTYRVPRVAETNGTVSIRVKASDLDGSTIEQTVLGAYAIK